MKVAYINCLSSRRGLLGVAKKIRGQIRAVKTLGLDMDIFLFDQRRPSGGDDIPFFPQGTGPVTDRLSVFYRYGQIAKRIDLYNYDFVVLRYSGADFSAFCPLFERFGKKIITEHHTKEFPETLTYKSSLPQRILTILMERYLGPRILKKCRGVIAVTDEIKAYELSRVAGRRPACTIPNGIFVDDIPPSGCAPYDGRRLNMVCLANHFEPWQGLDRIILGIAQYGDNGPALKLKVAGRVPTETVALADTLLGKGSRKISFLGRLDGDALEKVMEDSHIAFSSLALFRKQMKEACSLKTREYMARGIPFVLAYIDPDVPASSEFALSVPPDGSPVNMAQVVSFAENVLSRDQISVHMRDVAHRRLDWKHKLQTMWDFLQGL